MNHKVLLHLVLLLCLFYGQGVSCQVAALLERKEVTWVGKIKQEYIFEDSKDWSEREAPPRSEDIESVVETIKIDNFSTCIKDATNQSFFTDFILQKIDEDEIDVYSIETNKQLTKKEYEEAISLSDTVITYDPLTLSEKEQVVKNFNPYNIIGYEMEEFWFFDESKNQIKTLIGSINPIYVNKEGQRIPLFKIYGEQFPFDRFDAAVINEKHLVWIKQTSKVIDLNAFEVLKQDHLSIEEIIWKSLVDNDSNVFDPYDLYCHRKFPIQTRKYILNGSIDTVTTFDPVSYEETITYVENQPMTHNDISTIESQQIWVINNANKAISSYIKTITPRVKREMMPEVFVYYKIFLIRY